MFKKLLTKVEDKLSLKDDTKQENSGALNEEEEKKEWNLQATSAEDEQELSNQVKRDYEAKVKEEEERERQIKEMEEKAKL